MITNPLYHVLNIQKPMKTLNLGATNRRVKINKTKSRYPTICYKFLRKTRDKESKFFEIPNKVAAWQSSYGLRILKMLS